HRAKRHDVSVHDLQLRWISILHSGELEEISQAESVTIHLDSCHGLEECDFFRLQEIGAPDEYATGPIEQPRFARGHRRRQELVAELLHVAEWMQVENHQVARDPLESPVM